ncbi:MAG: aminotransferase class I/II-fold pyridoxal phosphate-dependent enzyme [Deltaproteobacteria bacterium]|nr:aminotransferase class I/II-fold pyridoxal phosphate-dependent enzyme [Deltaproteobacteria bacterium]
MSDTRVSKKLRGFGSSVFAEMTKLSNEHGAVNLSQGFPDFEGPVEIVESVIRAFREGHNQYARSMGHPELVEAISATRRAQFGLQYDPMTEVLVASGGTEVITSAILGLVEPEDEVILVEPFYDSYPAAIAMAGGSPRFVTLRHPGFRLDRAELEAAFSKKTKLLVLNTPHNPTGRVFDTAELAMVAELCIRHDVLVLSDEVYEHILFDGTPHVPLPSVPGMRDRTLVVSSAGKTYSFTGWKIGWATGPMDMIKAVQAAHQFVTFSTATPIQVGLARAMSTIGPEYYEQLRTDYQQRRDFMVEILDGAGFEVSIPKGTYFVMADFSKLFPGQDDRAVAVRLVKEYGVAAIPPSSFYAKEPDQAKSLLRFAFPKRQDTLSKAAERLGRLKTHPPRSATRA